MTAITFGIFVRQHRHCVCASPTIPVLAACCCLRLSLPQFRMGTIQLFLFLHFIKKETHRRHRTALFCNKNSFVVRENTVHAQAHPHQMSVHAFSLTLFIFILKIIYINFTVADVSLISIFVLCGGMDGKANNMHANQLHSILKEQGGRKRLEIV